MHLMEANRWTIAAVAVIATMALAITYTHSEYAYDLYEYVLSSEEKREILDLLNCIEKTVRSTKSALKALQQSSGSGLSLGAIAQLHADIDFLYAEIDQIANIDAYVKGKRKQLVQSLHDMDHELDEMKKSLGR